MEEASLFNKWLVFDGEQKVFSCNLAEPEEGCQRR